MRGLVICIEGAPLFEKIKSELLHKLDTGNGFFKAASFCLDGGNHLNSEQRQALIELCVENGMVYDETISTALRKEDNRLTRGSNGDADDSGNVVINRNVRSGQRVIAKKDLVVVGNVNPGAELIAGGNIVVMGSLRGLAHAGAEGNLFATITAQEMLPSQIRIADIVACNPDRNETLPVAQTEIAYVKDQEIVVEKFNNNSKNLKGISIA